MALFSNFTKTIYLRVCFRVHSRSASHRHLNSTSCRTTASLALTKGIVISIEKHHSEGLKPRKCNIPASRILSRPSTRIAIDDLRLLRLVIVPCLIFRLKMLAIPNTFR